ncbi:uncharacterized protein LOC111633460 [Centruroides sculpturatus]|uniref:uncharacterized protein LOC111633460 n=1 Tax=Centruroides sculpturatus TaxID=218467 RepID=UPI000C6E56D7|nr:uncharacterized protein LOC111633460 [Centruroides sculpturatus]
MKIFIAFMIIFVLLAIESNTNGIFFTGRENIYPADQSGDEKVPTQSEKLQDNKNANQDDRVYLPDQNVKTADQKNKISSRLTLRKKKFFSQLYAPYDNKGVNNFGGKNITNNTINNNINSEYRRPQQNSELKDWRNINLNILFYVFGTEMVILTSCVIFYIAKRFIKFCQQQLETRMCDIISEQINNESLNTLRFTCKIDTDRPTPMHKEKFPICDKNDYYLSNDKSDKYTQTEDISTDYLTNHILSAEPNIELDQHVVIEETPISDSMTDIKFDMNEDEEEVTSEMRPLLTISKEYLKANLKRPKRFFSFMKRKKNEIKKVRFNPNPTYHYYDKNLDKTDHKMDFTWIRAIPSDKMSLLKELYDVLIKMDREGILQKNSSNDSNFGKEIETNSDASEDETLGGVPSQKCLFQEDDPLTESSSEDWEISPV